MAGKQKSVADDPILEAQKAILKAALPHIAFDGWSDAVIASAATEAGLDKHVAKLAFPRGGVDLAVFHHRLGDAEMVDRLKAADMAAFRVRERVALAVRTRLEIAEGQREAVRKAASMFALPHYAPDGARLVWETADRIWTALGDPSEDLNWYTKRAILSGVISGTTLYWLGDESEDRAATWTFLDRRIDEVMRFEKFKSAVRENPLGRFLTAGPDWLAARIRKPGGGPVDTGTPSDLPGGDGRV